VKRDERSILNAELSHAIANMGHTDVLMVTDAGFPIPREAWRIDLALTRGVPGLYEVLGAVQDELLAETVRYAEAVPENNPEMDTRIREMYEGTGTDIEPVPHEEIVEYGHRAKAIVRTGAFVPWGNVVIECGTDPKPWFDGENEQMPPDYARRYEEIYGEKP